MMVLTFLQLVLLFAAVGAEFCADHAPSGAVDGCSVPIGHFHYEEQFTPSCNKHDVCYDCGHKFGHDREWCDEMFLYHMLSTCSRKKKSLSCQHSAEIFYFAVRVGAHFHYHNTAPPYCSESWVPKCLQ